jgi:general nucleoside transport system permease protein
MEWLSILSYAAPVALAAVGETVVQRSGIINIGLEAAMLVGAFFGMLGSFVTHSPWIGLAAGVLAGVITTGIFGWFTAVLSCDQVVVGTAINLLAIGLTGTAYRNQFGQSGQLLTVAKIPGWHGIDAVTIGLIVSVPLVIGAIGRTGWGLALRAAGEYPDAAEAAGFSVVRLRMSALAIGGVFAGAAGAYLSVGITGSFAENMSAGRGFVAIAMVTFGRWRPGFVLLACLLIGLAESMQFRIQSYGWKVPFQLMIAMPYMLALLVLVIVGKGSRAPQALGVAYRKDK